jgi:hypothetical protein
MRYSKSQQSEIISFIKQNYQIMTDGSIASYLHISIIMVQKIRIQNRCIRNSDSKRIVRRLLKDTLCWSCKNAVPCKEFGCSWSEWFEPVDGWNAEYRYLDGTGGSWFVFNCPEYLGEGDQHKP